MTDNAASNVVWVYVGAYTRREPHVEGRSKGIHVLRFEPSSGRLLPEHVVTGIENPSYLAIHPYGNALYAISEVSDYNGKPVGSIQAYAIDAATHALSPLNQRSVKGAGPAYVSIDSSGKHVFVANYGGGSVTVFPVQPDFSLGGASDFVQHEGSSVSPSRQEGPHAHSIVLDDNDKYAFAADLGLDKVLIYRYDSEAGTITPNPDQPWARTKSGAGPRHIDFHPSQRFMYVINELDSTIVVYRYDREKGVMTDIQSVTTLPEGFDGRNYTADIHVHPSGRFVYGSNRGHDSIAIFDVDEDSGELSNYRWISSGGEVPRGFAVDPSGAFLLVANQNSDNLVVFSIDSKLGDPTPTGEIIDIPTPVCVKMIT